MDPLFKSHGIDKRLESTEYWSKYRNGRLNKYLLHQISRLRRAKSDEVYWVIANQLLSRSNIFAIQAMHHVFPKYHRDFKYSSVLSLIWGMHHIARSAETLDFQRTYIPKPDGRVRPLGVPSAIWRLYLHQYANLLWFRYGHKIHPNQHGFIPGKGTLTAWRSVLSIVNNPDIYEYDLKGFFDNVRTDKILVILAAWGLPPRELMRLTTINGSSPAMPMNPLLDETNAEHKLAAQQLYELGYQGEMLAWATDMIGKSDGSDRQEWNRGCPQGAPTSPLLSILPLSISDYKHKRKRVLIRYADDWIETNKWSEAKGRFIRLPTDMSQTTATLRGCGVEYNLDKSG